MWKVLSRVPADKVLLVSSLGLAGAAHFVPVVAVSDKIFVGWQCAYEGLLYLAHHFPVRAVNQQVDDQGLFDFVGCLSNPLFWSGVVALAMSKQTSGRRAGMIAALAGLAALPCTLCTLAFSYPPYPERQPLLGFYLWIVGIVLLTLGGVWKANAEPTCSPR